MSLKKAAETVVFRHGQFVFGGVKGPRAKALSLPAWFQEHKCSCSLPNIPKIYFAKKLTEKT
jgi:hypothetical protein